MSREEFAKVIVYLTAGSGKALSESALEVYFDLLSDLTFDALMVGAKRVLLHHKFATFPSIAELREAATQTASGEVTGLASAEAWALAWKAAGNTDPEVSGSFDRATKDLPPLVKWAMQVFGVNAMCYGEEPITVIRAQFMKVYEQLAAREREAALLPAATKRAIESQKPGAAPLPTRALQIAGWTPDAPPAAKN